MEISHKYKSLKSTEVNGIKLEIFEWCSKYYVRLYGNSENFVDIHIGENKVFAESLYQSQSGVLMWSIYGEMKWVSKTNQSN